MLPEQAVQRERPARLYPLFSRSKAHSIPLDRFAAAPGDPPSAIDLAGGTRASKRRVIEANTGKSPAGMGDFASIDARCQGRLKQGALSKRL